MAKPDMDEAADSEQEQVGSDFAQFFDDPRFSDVTIQFGSHEINAHRMILCARSPVLRRALGRSSPFQVGR